MFLTFFRSKNLPETVNFNPVSHIAGPNVAAFHHDSPKPTSKLIQTTKIPTIATTNGDYFKKCAPIVTCDPDAKYRTYNGSCNNLQNPNWGAALTPFYRLMNAEFNDGNK